MSSRASKDAFMQAKKYIKAKEVVTIYPEGTISHSGEMGKFYRGFEMVAKGVDGHIVPYYIDGIYGSFLSRSKSHFGKYSPFRRIVTISYLKPIPINSTADEVRETIDKYKDDHVAQ